jgi:peptidoglycan hydrolase-like amidase
MANIKNKYEEIRRKLRKLERRFFVKGFFLGMVVAVMLLAGIFVAQAAGADSSTRVDRVAENGFSVASKTSDPLQPLAFRKSEYLQIPAGQNEFIYTSSPQEIDFVYNAATLQWREKMPQGTSVKLFMRFGSQTEWSQWEEVTILDGMLGLQGVVKDGWQLVSGDLNTGISVANAKFIQYKVILKASDLGLRPEVKDVEAVAIRSTGSPLAGVFRFFNIFGAGAAQADGPRIISRAEWGADESWMTWDPEYADRNGNYTSDASKAYVNRVVIHHTAGINNYPDPAASVRAIYRYHAKEVVWQENGVTKYGWGDIGYNFLIDHLGNIYQGRAGKNGVVGAHAYGYNRNSIGIAMMGTFMTELPTSSAVNALTDLIAYKSIENKAGSSILLTQGHRDVNATACPGDAFYPQLSSVRDAANRKYRSQIMGETLRLTKAVSIFPEKPMAGQEVTASFEVKNNGDFPVELNSLGVAARWGSLEQNRDIGWLSHVIIDAGKTLTVSVKRQLNEVGSYRNWAAFQTIDGSWFSLTGENGIVNMGSFTVRPFANISMTSPLTISPSNPVQGQEVTISYKIRNNNPSAVKFKYLGVAARLNNSLNRDIGWTADASIPAGTEITVSQKKILSETGSYFAWAGYLTLENRWSAPVPDPGIVNRLDFKVLPFDYSQIKVVEALVIDPAGPNVGQEISASFAVKNFAQTAITLKNLGVPARLNNLNRDIGYQTNVTLLAGETCKITVKRIISEVGLISAWVGFMSMDGQWYKAKTAQDILGEKTFKTFSASDKIRQISSLVVKNKIGAGEENEATFKIHNFDSKPVTLKYLGVAARFNSLNVDFPWFSNITVPANSDYEIKTKKSFNSTGTYSAFVLMFPLGENWRTIPKNEPNLISQTTFQVLAFDHSKIVVSSSLVIGPLDPMKNQEVTAQVSIKNTGEYAARMPYLGVAARKLPENINVDIGWQRDVVLASGETKQISLKRIIPVSGTLHAWTAYQFIDGSWHNPRSENAQVVAALDFKVYATPPDLKQISSLLLSPENPAANQDVTATFKVKNFGEAPARLKYLGTAVRLKPNNLNRDFPWKSELVIDGGTEYTVSQTRKFSESGYYNAFTSHMFQNGSWQILPKVDGVVSSVDYSVGIFDYNSIRVTQSLAMTPAQPALGGTATIFSTVKNFSGMPIVMQNLGIAMRRNTTENWDVVWLTNLTLAAGESKAISGMTRALSAGSYNAWVGYQSSGTWRSAGAEPGVTASLTFAINQPAPPPSGPTIQVTSINGQYQIQNQSGTVLATKSANEISSVTYKNGTYYVTAPGFSISTQSYIRFVPVSGAIMKIPSYHDIPSWNPSLDDNTFRGVIETRYSNKSEKFWAINELPIEEALRGLAETGSSAPYEHIKTQTVAGRSYWYWHYTHGGKYGSDEIFHIKNSRNGNGDDQTYKGYGLEQRFPELVQSIADTSRQVVTYDGSVALTPYFSQSDGRTRSAQEVWGITYWPWLLSKPDPDCNGKPLLGHGVGLSGYGSVQRAARGENYRQILSYYYSGTSIGTAETQTAKIRIAIYGQ